MMHMYCFIRDSRKADALFNENPLHRKLSFREARLSETGLPRITVVGSSVNSEVAAELYFVPPGKHRKVLLQH